MFRHHQDSRVALHVVVVTTTCERKIFSLPATDSSNRLEKTSPYSTPNMDASAGLTRGTLRRQQQQEEQEQASDEKRHFPVGFHNVDFFFQYLHVCLASRVSRLASRVSRLALPVLESVK